MDVFVYNKRWNQLAKCPRVSWLTCMCYSNVHTTRIQKGYIFTVYCRLANIFQIIWTRSFNTIYIRGVNTRNGVFTSSNSSVASGGLFMHAYSKLLVITRDSEVIMFSPCVFVCVSVCLCLSLLVITRDSEVIMFSPCVFVCVSVCLSVCLCLSRSLSGRFNYERLVPHKQYFAGTLLWMSSCASYVSCTLDVIDDVTRSQSRSNFEIDTSPSIFEQERRSKAQNVGNANGCLSGTFIFRYNFR